MDFAGWVYPSESFGNGKSPAVGPGFRSVCLTSTVAGWGRKYAGWTGEPWGRATLGCGSRSKRVMADEMADVRRGGQGSVEFDESAEVGAVESRMSTVRTLVEDVNSAGETRFAQEIRVDGRIWRVVVEQLAG